MEEGLWLPELDPVLVPDPDTLAVFVGVPVPVLDPETLAVFVGVPVEVILTEELPELDPTLLSVLVPDKVIVGVAELEIVLVAVLLARLDKVPLAVLVGLVVGFGDLDTESDGLAVSEL